MRGIMWFREDLRINDNTALFNAAQKCHAGIIGIYIIDHSMWLKHHMAPCRVEFLLSGLKILQDDLNKLHIPLIIKQVKNTATLPSEIYQLIKTAQAQSIFFNRQYEVNELHRDQAVQIFLQKQNLHCFMYDDQVILPPGSALTQQGEFFKVFTPYKRAWYRAFQENGDIKLFKPLKPQAPTQIKSTPVPKTLPLFQSNIDLKQWPAGEQAAAKRLKHFIETKLFDYHKQRDFPALQGTSQLSPYLSTGMISPRQCFRAALIANQLEVDTGNKGALTWMNELIWRDFYKNILIHVPRISMNRAYRLETEKLAWRFDKKLFIAWQLGKTGFPIIDAAMRQLNLTGWMHNRLRMIVGMFLTKNLFFDWRLGEQYFISHLIDGDLAANNGGWQWCASTGTDAAPYFRIFNPLTQSRRFDPDGDFIRTYCPELANLDNRSIHAPYEKMSPLAKQLDYPQPIVNLAVSRKETIQAFKLVLKD